MQFATTPTRPAIDAVKDAERSVFWLDRPDRPAALPPLTESIEADLVIVGGGFTGLWTALVANDVDPDRDIVLIERTRVADGGTGRNGGFVAASITHGFGNGLSRWPDELPSLLAMGQRNLDEIETFVKLNGIDCDFRRAGEIDVAVAEHQIDELRQAVRDMRAFGLDVEFLDESEVKASIKSPTYLAGVRDRNSVALVDPARLAWGLLATARLRGIRVFEDTEVTGIDDQDDRVVLTTAHHRITTQRAVIATNAFPSLIPAVRHRVVPVYDYVLMTEPLTDSQWSDIGWHGREGLSDTGNQFHYYRPTQDGRILWGGYDAVYHSGNGFGPQFENDDDSYERLATHFLQTFPQLEGIRFSHAWGGAIDTCSRFTAFWGTEAAGKIAYVAGFTGLGVGASRFAAQVLLDLLDGQDTARTRLEMVQSKPIPFPPEPLRTLGIKWTTMSLQRADAHGGRRNLWLRALDRLGLGFDS
ncbi:MAG: NAD(P)/FAD-dependent oxidoreductase [Candidatus Nanopelagicales bacterium]